MGGVAGGLASIPSFGTLAPVLIPAGMAAGGAIGGAAGSSIGDAVATGAEKRGRATAVTRAGRVAEEEERRAAIRALISRRDSA